MTDIVIEKPSTDGSGRLIKVSIEFDGPTHYLRPAMGSRDRVVPLNGKTRLRNALSFKMRTFLSTQLLAPLFYFSQLIPP